MNEKKVALYGSWRSPITSDLIVAGTVRLGQMELDGEAIYWIEGRPAEKGRNVVVKRLLDGSTVDLTPMPFNARTRVHEYGGGSLVVSQAEVFFSNFADQRLYRVSETGEPVAITPEAELRYADGMVDRIHNRLICVREDHSESGREPVNTIAAVSLDESGQQTVLVSGNDFYSSPRLSPDGKKLVWLAWNHPNMPWDGTELWIADVQPDGSLANKTLVAGGVEESVFQPEWSPADDVGESNLYFVSDRSGWWNLYRWRKNEIEALCRREAEFGLPHWVFGMSTYAFVSPEEIVCAYTERGFSKLALLHLENLSLETIETPYTHIDGIRGASGRAVFIAGSPTESASVVSFDATTRKFETLRRSSELAIDRGYISVPQGPYVSNKVFFSTALVPIYARPPDPSSKRVPRAPRRAERCVLW